MSSQAHTAPALPACLLARRSVQDLKDMIRDRWYDDSGRQPEFTDAQKALCALELVTRKANKDARRLLEIEADQYNGFVRWGGSDYSL